MALYNLIDPPKKKYDSRIQPGIITSQEDSVVKGINTLTDEYMYKGMSENEASRYKRVNENLKSKGEVYDPKSKRIYKANTNENSTGNLVPMQNVFDAFKHNYSKEVKIPSPELLPGLLRANGLYMDPKSGDVFPIR